MQWQIVFIIFCYLTFQPPVSISELQLYVQGNLSYYNDKFTYKIQKTTLSTATLLAFCQDNFSFNKSQKNNKKFKPKIFKNTFGMLNLPMYSIFFLLGLFEQ